jgi:hypothetical protein
MVLGVAKALLVPCLRHSLQLKKSQLQFNL